MTRGGTGLRLWRSLAGLTHSPYLACPSSRAISIGQPLRQDRLTSLDEFSETEVMMRETGRFFYHGFLILENLMQIIFVDFYFLDTFWNGG